jgi:hypothetical protein
VYARTHTCHARARARHQLHAYLAANVLRKPLVIEEFGLTWFKKTPDQLRVLMQVRGGRGTCAAQRLLLLC